MTTQTPKDDDPGRWPFEPLQDPLQPGDHEPARLPDNLVPPLTNPPRKEKS